MYTVKVNRFELYPADEPTCYAVGFTGTCDNGRSNYQDTQVSLKDSTGKTNDEIVKLAWDNLKDGFVQTMNALDAKSSLIGTVFTTSDIIDKEVQTSETTETSGVAETLDKEVQDSGVAETLDKVN
jgi:hypothetical protein